MLPWAEENVHTCNKALSAEERSEAHGLADKKKSFLIILLF